MSSMSVKDGGESTTSFLLPDVSFYRSVGQSLYMKRVMTIRGRGEMPRSGALHIAKREGEQRSPGHSTCTQRTRYARQHTSWTNSHIALGYQAVNLGRLWKPPLGSTVLPKAMVSSTTKDATRWKHMNQMEAQ
jgi:hypothetical protein